MEVADLESASDRNLANSASGDHLNLGDVMSSTAEDSRRPPNAMNGTQLIPQTEEQDS